MAMTRFETLLMHNPLRRLQQEKGTLPTFAKLGATLAGGHVLEPGCGDGVGAELLVRVAQARRVDGFDVDRRELKKARARALRQRLPIHLWRGDIQHIATPQTIYDAVVCFGVLHHAEDWRAALRELYRVLRPGGQLCLEESYAAFILHPFWRRLMAHPTRDRFDGPLLLSELASLGFARIREQRIGQAFGLIVCQKP